MERTGPGDGRLLLPGRWAGEALRTLHPGSGSSGFRGFLPLPDVRTRHRLPSAEQDGQFLRGTVGRQRGARLSALSAMSAWGGGGSIPRLRSGVRVWRIIQGVLLPLALPSQVGRLEEGSLVPERFGGLWDEALRGRAMHEVLLAL